MEFFQSFIAGKSPVELGFTGIGILCVSACVLWLIIGFLKLLLQGSWEALKWAFPTIAFLLFLGLMIWAYNKGYLASFL